MRDPRSLAAKMSDTAREGWLGASHQLARCQSARLAGERPPLGAAVFIAVAAALLAGASAQLAWLARDALLWGAERVLAGNAPSLRSLALAVFWDANRLALCAIALLCAAASGEPSEADRLATQRRLAMLQEREALRRAAKEGRASALRPPSSRL